MTSALLTDTELAGVLGIELEKLHELRRRHSWPHVRLGRFQFRFTEAQVDQILQLHSATAAETGRPSRGASVPGQTARSAGRQRRTG